MARLVRPRPAGSRLIQGEAAISLEVDVYNLDLFDCEAHGETNKTQQKIVHPDYSGLRGGDHFRLRIL